MEQLTEQLTVRLTPSQRAFIREACEEVRGIDPRVEVTEAVIVRHYIEQARQRRMQEALKGTR